MEPLGFLGIVVKSLRVAAMDVERASSPLKRRYPFAHKGELTYLVLGGHGVDGRRHRSYVADGLVEPNATVHRLDYRILDRDGGLVQRFRVWTELPPGQASEGWVPVLPLAFEFKAKSFSQAARGPCDRPGFRIAPDAAGLVPRADHEFVVDGPCLVGQSLRRSCLELFEVPKTHHGCLRCV